MATVVNSTIVVPLSAVSTPLIFFDSERASHILIATYIHIACLGAIIWDVLDNLDSDYRLLIQRKIQLPTVLYFSTRISLLGYSLGRAILLTRPMDDCAALQRSNSVFSIIFIASTTLLSSIRVWAIYGMARQIVVVFGSVWLVCFGMTLTIWHTFGASHIGTTHYCVEVVNGHLLGPMLFTLATNETLMYIAIALRIAQGLPEGPGSYIQRFRLIWTGSSLALPRFSKALLHDSHTYFLVVVITKILVATSAFAFRSPINSMFITIDLTIVSVLSSRVFRNLKFISQLGGDVSHISTAIVFSSSPERNNALAESRMQTTNNVIMDLEPYHGPSECSISRRIPGYGSHVVVDGPQSV